MYLRILGGVLASAITFAAPALAEPVSARTDGGVVVGTHADGVEVFKGVPYAAAPVGPLRWRPPQAVRRWAEPRDATRFGAACPQDPTVAGNPQPQAEDCLFLNIWTPATKPARLAPVLVYIHGGGNVGGAGSQAIYDGEAFARDGVVAVTLNYRLGALGFFAHPALAAQLGRTPQSGNYGLMDQIAALRWVKRNIRQFGGDPNQVTLAGQSAGGEAVYRLMTTETTKGLFQRAIAASGPAWAPPKSRATAEAEDIGLVESLGLPRDVTAATLRSLPPERLFRNPSGVGPYIDGELVRGTVLDAFDHGRNQAEPLMIGSVSDEGVLLAAYPEASAQLASVLGDQAGKVRELYRPLAGDEPSYRRQLFGDAIFGAPVRDLARLQSAKAPTYLYNFDYVISRDRGRRPGAFHTSDIVFAFDMVSRWWPTASAEDLAMGRLVHACWVAFVKHGAPACSPDAPWRPYDPTTDQTFVFAPGGAHVTPHYRKAQYDAVLPLLPRR